MRVLVQSLPPDSALFRSMPDLAGWTVTDHLLAAVLDRLGTVAYNAVVGPHADPKKLRSFKPPQPVQRPGPRRQRRRATSEETRQVFRQLLG